MRSRKPWVRIRLMLDGWNVRFMAVPLSSDYLLFVLESLQIYECLSTPAFLHFECANVTNASPLRNKMPLPEAVDIIVLIILIFDIIYMKCY